MAWVAENEPIPVRQYTFANLTLTPKKMAVISVITKSLAKQSDAETIIGTIFREDSGLSLDSAYLSATAASTAAHAGLLNGVSGISAYAGGDEVAAKTDLAALVAAVAPGGSGQVVFLASPTRALQFGIKFPELAGQVEMLPSAALADTRVVALDPQALVHGFAGAPSLEASDQAVLHMEDDPDPISDSGVAAPVMSAWQIDALALRCELEAAFGMRRSGAVSFVDNPTW
jgi:hypothetical protein